MLGVWQTAGGGATDEEETLGRNVAAEEVLLRLPGVNHANYRLIMRKARIALLDHMLVGCGLCIERVGGVCRWRACLRWRC